MMRPNGGSQNNKAHVTKKVRKTGGGYDHKHSSLNFNGKSYNGFEINMYVAISLECQPQKINKKRKTGNLQSLVQDAQ